MPKNVTYEFENLSDILETLHNTTASLKGFSNLLDIALHNGGGDLQGDAFGICNILDNLIFDLEEIASATRLEFDRVKASDLRLRPLEYAATRFKLPVEDVADIILMVTNIDVAALQRSKDTARKSTTTVETTEIVTTTTVEDVDIGSIAQSLNLKQATVERVIQELVSAHPNLSIQAPKSMAG
ncbi:hypothetical protein ABID16_000086 [Rhizobium aquaticum]|uniref:Uncharacterized protein n=1 Tax=Rhizobium aquaticum TaxID=1549636 RepID=A0ABV2ITG3_9HYPH